MKRLGCVIGVKENEGKETQPVDDNVAVKRGADSRIICKNSHSNLIFDSVDDAKLQNCSIQNLSLASRGWLFARSFASPLFWGRVRGKKLDKTSVMGRNDGVGVGIFEWRVASGPPAAG